MKRIGGRLAGLTMAVLFAIVAILTSMNYQHRRRPQILRRERYTAAQILDLARPSLRRLYPQFDQLNVSITPHPLYALDGIHHCIWLIECTDGAGRYIGSENWDGETGALIALTQDDPRLLQGADMPISNRQAFDFAHSWLLSLGISSPTSEWRLMGAPRCHGAAWRSCWRTKEWWATVTLDVSVGKLLSVRCLLASQTTSPREQAALRDRAYRSLQIDFR